MNKDLYDCPHKSMWGFSCNFEPRYDVSPPSPEAIAALDLLKLSINASFHDSFEDIIEKMQTRTYVGDICVSCGKFVVRPEKST